jgi:hypothetical protein
MGGHSGGVPDLREKGLEEGDQSAVLLGGGNLVDGGVRVDHRALRQGLKLHRKIAILFGDKLGPETKHEVSINKERGW